MTAGLLDEVKVPTEAPRPAFEPTRAERVRIWATCLTLAAAVQLAVVSALAPRAEPRYVVQLEAVERRPMFVPSRFAPSAINRAATESAATEGAMNRAATERAATERAMNRAATESAGAINRAATEGAMNRAATEGAMNRAATEGAMNRAATEGAATEGAATGRAATVRGRKSVGARFIAQVGKEEAGGGGLDPVSEGAATGAVGSEADKTKSTPPGHVESPSPAPPSTPTPTPELTPEAWAGAVGAQVSRGLRYPRAAEEDGVEGVTLLRLHVEADGRIVSIELVRSSGDQDLDEAALSRARALTRLPPPPDGIRAIDVPVRFRLP